MLFYYSYDNSFALASRSFEFLSILSILCRRWEFVLSFSRYLNAMWTRTTSVASGFPMTSCFMGVIRSNRPCPVSSVNSAHPSRESSWRQRRNTVEGLEDWSVYPFFFFFFIFLSSFQSQSCLIRLSFSSLL